MKYIAACALLAATLWPSAAQANYATCLLDKLPGTANHASHAAVVQTCLRQHPSGFSKVISGSGRGWFGYKSGAECTIKKAKNTTFSMSAGVIGAACRCLYDPPETIKVDGETYTPACA